MSRNIRKKFDKAPPKVTKRRVSNSSSSSLTDEEGYSALEDISDSEDNEEEDVDAAEERHIITNERTSRSSRSSRPRNGQASDNEDDHDEDDDADSELSATAEDDDNDDDDSESNTGLEDDSTPASWNGIASEPEDAGHDQHLQSPPQLQRHVRFNIPFSDSDATETEDEDSQSNFFPDIFVEQSSLDPRFRKEIERDDDDSSASSAIWDQMSSPYVGYRGPTDMSRSLADLTDPRNLATLEEMLANASAENSPTAMVGPFSSPQVNQESDGYESDGETTDDDDEPGPPIRRASMDADQAAGTSSAEETKKTRSRQGKPRVGSFDLDSAALKPIAVVNPSTRKMMIFTPYRRDHLDLAPETFNMGLDAFGAPVPRAFVRNSGAAMIGGNAPDESIEEYLNSQFSHFGAQDAAWYALQGHALLDFSTPSDEDMADDDEDRLSVTDFLHVDDDEEEPSDEEANNLPVDSEVYDLSVHSFPNPSSPTESVARRFSHAGRLSHLSPENVSAFRRNQLNQRLINSSQATADSLAFSSPYHDTALRGIKADRFATAATPIAPLRRPKRKSFDMPDLSVSPSQKRKGPAEDHQSHKRQRSIPDVDLLRI